jgi:hypothetical protein
VCEEQRAPHAALRLTEVMRFDGAVSLGRAIGITYATSESAVFRLEPDRLTEMKWTGATFTDPGGPTLFGRYPDDLWARKHGNHGSKHGYVFGPWRHDRFEMTNVVREDASGEAELTRMQFEKEGGDISSFTCKPGAFAPKAFRSNRATLFDARGSCTPELFVRGPSASVTLSLDPGIVITGFVHDEDWFLIAAAEQPPRAFAGAQLTPVGLPAEVASIESVDRGHHALIWMVAQVATDAGEERALYVGASRAKCWARVSLPNELSSFAVDDTTLWMISRHDGGFALHRATVM